MTHSLTLTNDVCYVYTAAFLIVTSGVGVTGGAHRLWCHRSYKAKWPLRVLLALAHTIALQVTISLSSLCNYRSYVASPIHKT